MPGATPKLTTSANESSCFPIADAALKSRAINPSKKSIIAAIKIKTLEEFIQYFGADRKCSVSRELTKIFEENKRGTLLEVCDHFKQKTVKGEIVVIVQGKDC